MKNSHTCLVFRGFYLLAAAVADISAAMGAGGRAFQRFATG